jgi:hypothetical protein
MLCITRPYRPSKNQQNYCIRDFTPARRKWACMGYVTTRSGPRESRRPTVFLHAIEAANRLMINWAGNLSDWEAANEYILPQLRDWHAVRCEDSR